MQKYSTGSFVQFVLNITDRQAGMQAVSVEEYLRFDRIIGDRIITRALEGLIKP
jgi:hypothetical protein